MCHETIKMPFTGEHVCEMVKNLYSGRVVFYNGIGSIKSGVTVHLVGGHSRGLQSVRVKTENGYLCLASDATHFYENFLMGKPFPIVVDLEDMLNGFKLIKSLATSNDMVIPGHDPLVKNFFPKEPDAISVKYIKRFIPKLIFPAFKIGIFFEYFLIKFSSFFEKPVVPITTLFFNFKAIFNISNVHLGIVKSMIKSTFLKTL